ncbi:hypothetical protein [Curtobacterium sp. 260]|uniref:hypothetical protein n=1 Tax=Curtobacterium sp. 260 TaxID=2817748 RepID=UPI002786B6BD|nr:hypothetical protein [Curtobacterium sp. 260]MDP9736556.1 hypothetical protein [Curtobacterium sp. 260]
MIRYVGEVFVVRRDGVLVAEPTGGLARRDADAPPQSWFATIDDETAGLPRIGSGRVSAEIELLSPIPDSGLIGRVVRLSPAAAAAQTSTGFPPARADDAMDLLELVPDRWQPYEVRFGELDAERWEAFVGTLFPVPVEELDAVLGAGSEQLVRIEPWLAPHGPDGGDRAAT